MYAFTPLLLDQNPSLPLKREAVSLVGDRFFILLLP